MDVAALKNFDRLANNMERLVELPRWQRALRNPLRMSTEYLLVALSRLRSRPIHWDGSTFWGEQMRLVFPENVSRLIFQYGVFEIGLTTIVLNTVKPGMVFFDVGAHIGYYTLLASHLVGSGGQVRSFEPTPGTLRELKHNIRDRGNVQAEHAAVYSHDTTLELTDFGMRFFAHNTLGRGKLSDSEQSFVKPATTHKVPAVSLDSYIARTGVRPDFVKIDAEGAELSILEGMERTLRDVRPQITVEVGDVHTDEPSEGRKVLQYVMDRGYELWAYDKRTRQVVPHELKEKYEHDNILLKPT